MPRQNRVNPAGEIVADPSRASTLMGNRGCLHDDGGRVVRMSARPAWVSCLLEFQGWKRELMKPGHYTELFFLDEPTALAAGHRPCSTCRRDAAKRFTAHWARSTDSPEPIKVATADRQLRIEQARAVHPRLGAAGALPDGTAVRDDRSGRFYVLRKGGALPWSFDGYGAPIGIDRLPVANLTVLTPPSVLRVLSDGYVPLFHPSAQ